MKKTITILGLETSCDETAAALVRAEKNKDNYRFGILKNIVYSQIPSHRKYGGVVPEVAAREHAVRLPLILKSLGDEYGKKKLQKMVDAIAVTNGPGLVTSLLVGVEVARTMSYAWQKPLVPVNHLEGHVYANLLCANSQIRNPRLRRGFDGQAKSLPRRRAGEIRNFSFPLLVLIVSGGHTELVLMKKHLSYKLLGSTRDDAAGEAFDKTAKLLGLPYPGGPALAMLASRGNPTAIAFPRPMLEQNNLDFSFAGLKTAVAIYLQKHHPDKLENVRMTELKAKTVADVAASFQAAVVETLVGKTLHAAEKYRPQTMALAGGVAANLALRYELHATLAQQFPKINLLVPELAYTTDNAAMIAAAGAVRFLNGHTTPWEKVRVDPQLQLK
ncbi:tRNA (adenosine(37)-N6)-threonylcarbamoyltransferase complex transferase subunit TsaD [Candidatus Uhrbacteria bacterium RIFCSPHIGHO2_12_FULL_46_13]|uniref:tRNA N6-adenosine threonylcarbamoyltransferase n=1 Tax=Candidatus Uhrbacteria bacterium RIFCSPLOWO2_01_FULL_47_25 TaxID=1802402 RepID=A0A1F7UTQ3_9BACT|nr:MAG: tRNA (adenosine(37)-N6)-threonylcarbamoyltransferase complex transferase subunit TsaD [Candidatus Uhrbacteria bacterium RIFCSPHIGHO2_01_FULL_46_23]OGL68500.1 MAG: tRNA (adenosine(37)-N6)-threonylcarbamoyltransferase complex transferase subunit TsaD [Candidatus Uhrbacteria bacterium RIFCSPHIGHO2_02_FULL_47_29]OGL75574.1 MAG: tRNA (adenosine(37)-N6)-threonylcarbamoyltransferase complex transferase subunit TsaD [Candidatus Uhrbacteria bacterium RIFCSPHIGHO2_12_FULL_46_13]OGL81088.1 MAG: tRN